MLPNRRRRRRTVDVAQVQEPLAEIMHAERKPDRLCAEFLHRRNAHAARIRIEQPKKPRHRRFAIHALALLFAIALLPPAHAIAGPIADDDRTIAGFLDQPLESYLPTRHTHFIGWAAARHGIERVEVVIDGKLRLLARSGIAREDVKALFSDYPGGDKSGFELVANLGFLPLGNHELETIATDTQGNFKSLGKRTYVTDTFLDTWSDLLAARGRRPLDTF